jgi:aspartate aminotransferase
MRFNEFEPPELDEVMRTQAEWADTQQNHDQPINATIGVLMDPEYGAPFQPPTMSTALHDSLMNIQDDRDRGYQSQRGNASYLEHLADWVLGGYDSEWPQVQSLGGTGALHQAASLLARITDERELLIDPGWGNHGAIFADFEQRTYTRIIDGHAGYDHDVYMEAVDGMPDHGAFLLQGAGYNNDGHERTPEQWDEVFETVARKHGCAILDLAYFGLAGSFEADAVAVRKLIDSQIMGMVAVSNSKNLGLYQERLGALYLVHTPERIGALAQAVLSAEIIRPEYSNPPRLAAQAAAGALASSSQRRALETEISAIRHAVLDVNRRVLAEALGAEYEWIAETRGLFIKLIPDGFTEKQRDDLKLQGILVLPSSRINLGGIHPDNMSRFAHAIKQVI